MKNQLTDAERVALRKELGGTKCLTAVSLGYGLRGQDNFGGEAVIAQLPESLADANISVCGAKGFLVDEMRSFKTAEGGTEAIRCAVVAALEIVDSPVHVHSMTLEVYLILAGEGLMILNDRVINVNPGKLIVIPPGVHHGLVSNFPDNPVKVLLTSSPGLAPKDFPSHRDEQIIADKTSIAISKL